MKTFLAIFTCAENSEAHEAWKKLGREEQKSRLDQGPELLAKWSAKYQAQVIYDGGHLGEVTKQVDNKGIRDIPSQMGTFLIVQAKSHEEAAEMFVEHPHFAVFPGNGVEIIEQTGIPRV
nr:YciI family protein [Bacteriovorax sp. HI3]